MTKPAVTISADHARRFLVRRHLLAPPRSLPAKPASVLKVVERLGLLQFDPIDVPGARNHDIVLHARIAGYRRGWCEKWLYGDDRQLIELYNKSLNTLPTSQLAHYRVTWELFAQGTGSRILRERADVAKAILARVKAKGPQSTAAFADHKDVVEWWWAPTRVARAVMEALFVTGRLGIARREAAGASRPPRRARTERGRTPASFPQPVPRYRDDQSHVHGWHADAGMLSRRAA